MIYYYFVCKRKLWLSCNEISMESENEDVCIGKFVDENSYKAERKHLLINNEINIDFIKKDGVIHEVKKSRRIEEASIWQVKYYLYYLLNNGVEGITAKIDYPLLKKVVEVELDESDHEKLREIIEEINMILNTKIPKFVEIGICKKCAFVDLCMI